MKTNTLEHWFRSIMDSTTVERLIKAARSAMDCCYGITLGSHRYGAAVLASDGTIYSSGLYRSETRTLSLHAEQAALAHAAAHGKYTILAVAIVSDADPSGREFTNPCGLCKQLLYESARRSGTEMKLILTNMAGDYLVKDLREFIVYPWP